MSALDRAIAPATHNPLCPCVLGALIKLCTCTWSKIATDARAELAALRAIVEKADAMEKLLKDWVKVGHIEGCENSDPASPFAICEHCGADDTDWVGDEETGDFAHGEDSFCHKALIARAAYLAERAKVQP